MYTNIWRLRMGKMSQLYIHTYNRLKMVSVTWCWWSPGSLYGPEGGAELSLHLLLELISAGRLALPRQILSDQLLLLLRSPVQQHVQLILRTETTNVHVLQTATSKDKSTEATITSLLWVFYKSKVLNFYNGENIKSTNNADNILKTTS